MKYYEIEFAHREEIENNLIINTPDRYSICILAEREPQYEEAELFCKEDMKNLGYNMVSDVLEISKEEAYDFFLIWKTQINFQYLSKVKGGISYD